MDCDVFWKAKLSPLHDENVLLKHQFESTVKERENIQLEHQRLFNSIKATRAQHQKEINRMFKDVTQKTYAYAEWIVDSGCSKYMTANLQLLRNLIEKFMGTVCCGNDHFAAIISYVDYIQGNLTIGHVYYVEGLGHNLFLVGQLCDGDLEVALRSNTCSVQNLKGDDLLMGSQDSNLYTIYISEMVASSLVCLMYRATSTKYWLWHRWLSYLNFDTINQLTSHDLVDGLLKFKYRKNHLCSAGEQGKRRKPSLSPKLVPSTESKLELLHMELCRPMRVSSINGKKYILVIVDNYSRRNRTLIEAAQTMRIFSKAPEFLWAEAIATACFTQNCSIIHTRHNKTPYELIRGRKPNVYCFYVFGTLCYPTNDHDDLGKTKMKADIELDNLFGPMHEEYYVTSSVEVSDNSAANSLDKDHTSSSSSIVVDQDDAPPIVVSSKEQVVTEPNSPVLNEVADEFVQEDIVDFDGHMFHNAQQTPKVDVAESSSTYQDPSNMHQFYQQHRLIDRWTKNHPLEQVIGDPLKPVMTRKRHQTDAEVCIYALTVSTIEPKNIKEATLDHSRIESMQDELNQFKRLDVLEHVECPVGRNITKVKWIWKCKTNA
nr:Gag-Pol polyprotein [Tanacetum cinerariifolium]GEY70401.1 Gag-Pol polyprotein [Tanacetum cinerariifolium]GEY70433.1 Gag-Pol polyprotein [Tanacetum cinerariifolium]